MKTFKDLKIGDAVYVFMDVLTPSMCVKKRIITGIEVEGKYTKFYCSDMIEEIPDYLISRSFIEDVDWMLFADLELLKHEAKGYLDCAETIMNFYANETSNSNAEGSGDAQGEDVQSGCAL